MKKRTFKAFIAVFAVVAILALTACSSYTSHYKAVAFVHTNTAKNAEMSFSSFKGTMVFKLKIAGGEEKITCSASLGEGSAKVYYDCGGAKKELFSVLRSSASRALIMNGLNSFRNLFVILSIVTVR